MLNKTQLEAAYRLPTVQAFLAVLRMTEHGRAWVDNPDVYRRHFAGKVWSHAEVAKGKPRLIVRAVVKGKTYDSSACGAYQFINRTWDGLLRIYPWLEFNNAVHQDLAAIALIEGRKALTLIIAGKLEEALTKTSLSIEWASLPNSPHGQPIVPLATCLAFFAERMGVQPAPVPMSDAEQPVIAANEQPNTDDRFFSLEPASIATPVAAAPIDDHGTSTTQEEQPMATQPSTIETIASTVGTVGGIVGSFVGGPWLGAAIKGLASVAPELIRLFGNGSQMTERNAKAAEAVGKIILDVSGASNEQTAAQIIANDPAKLAQFRLALNDQWDKLVQLASEADRMDAELQDKAQKRAHAMTEGATTFEQALVRNWPFILVGTGQFFLTTIGLGAVLAIIFKVLNMALDGKPVPDLPAWAVALLSSVVTVVILEWRSVLSYVLGSTQGSAMKNLLISKSGSDAQRK